MPLFRACSRLASVSLSALIVLFALSLAGCHSAYIAATVSNRTDKPVSLIQIDYPSASFGTQTLAPGQDFHYRFKVLGAGPVKLTYTDASQRETKSTGPELREGNEGTLQILVTPTGVHWTPPAFPASR